MGEERVFAPCGKAECKNYKEYKMVKGKLDVGLCKDCIHYTGFNLYVGPDAEVPADEIAE